MLSPFFYKRLSWMFMLAPLGILVGVAAFAASIEIRDLDLWLHMKMGEYILQHRMVPSVDVLSCTFLDKPWVNHEWLFQVIVHLVKTFQGMDGLIYMQVGLVLLTFMAMFLLTYDGDRLPLMLAGLYFFFEIFQTRFTIRPDIFSLFFVVIYLTILLRYADKRWLPWALFCLQVVWTNIHGFSLFGIVIVGIFWLAEMIRRKVILPWQWSAQGSLSDDAFSRMSLALVLLVLASFINPLGVHGAWYPVGILLDTTGASRIFFENITELKRPLSWGTLLDMSELHFKALIYLSGISFILNFRRINIGLLLLWIGALLFSLMALRNMVYFALVAYVVIMVNASGRSLMTMLPFTFRDPRIVHVAGVLIGLSCMYLFLRDGNTMAAFGYYDQKRYERKSEFLGVAQNHYPNEAVDFLVEHNICGNFFNDFNSGAYLIGRAYPNIRVYMDGRTELRGSAFFEHYLRIWDKGDEKTFDEDVKRFNLTGAFLNTASSRPSEKLLKMLYAKKDWKLVYFEHDALIFLKDVPEYASIIAKYSLDLAQWKVPDFSLERAGINRFMPYRHMSRAESLLTLELYDQAWAESEAAMRIYPSGEGLWRLRADILRAKKDYQQAFYAYRLAALYSDHSPSCVSDLARAYFEIGDYSRAIEQADAVIEQQSQHVAAHVIKGKALVKNGQYEKGYDILVQALKIKDAKSSDLLEIVRLALEAGRSQDALRMVQEILKVSPDNIKVKVCLAEVHQALGQLEPAREVLRRVLEKNPDDASVKEALAKLTLATEGEVK